MVRQERGVQRHRGPDLEVVKNCKNAKKMETQSKKKREEFCTVRVNIQSGLMEVCKEIANQKI